MVLVLAILTGVAMLATVVVLFTGMFGFVFSTSDPLRSNRLMRWRVMLQGLSLVLFVLLLLAMNHRPG